MTTSIAKTLETKTEKVDGNTGEIIQVHISEAEIVSKVKNYTGLKTKKVFFNGKRYFEFDDWQYVAMFYELKVRTFDPRYVDMGNHKGFHAKASVVDKTNTEVSRAEAYCLDDEPNWRNKPLFQLASMAQTRAASKALANLFRPVAIMCGFEGTPQEEVEDVVAVPSPKVNLQVPRPSTIPEAFAEAQQIAAGAPTANEIDQAEEKMPEWADVKPKTTPKPVAMNQPATPTLNRISKKQQGLLMFKKKAANISDGLFADHIRETYGIESIVALDWHDMKAMLEWIDANQQAPNQSEIPL